MERGLHLGLTPWRLSGAATAKELVEQAHWAESRGYDSFFLPENHFTGPAALPDPLLLLAAVAAATERILLGTSSWLLPIRHPLLAAEQVAVLDQLCEGRLLLGLGRGFQPGMLESFGVAQKDKREKFATVLAGMLAAWRQQQVQPLPVQQPHPPLWVAAFGPRAIAQAGGLGLPYLASPMENLTQLEQNFAAHAGAVSAAGHKPIVLRPLMRTIFIHEDSRRCTEVRARLEQSGMGGTDLIGSCQQVAEQLACYRDRLAITHLIAVRPRVSGIEESLLRSSLEALLTVRQAGRHQPALKTSPIEDL